MKVAKQVGQRKPWKWRLPVYIWYVRVERPMFIPMSFASYTAQNTSIQPGKVKAILFNYIQHANHVPRLMDYIAAVANSF